MTDQPRRARHLMDPDNPRPRASAEDVARLERVQRWVLSVLIATTIMHLSVGLVLLGLNVDEGALVPALGLCVLGGAFGVVALASAFAIHQRSLVSPWLVLGTLPGLVGVLLVLR